MHTTELNLTGKHILLGITGSIAAYKSAELIRLLKEAGADVRVVMTEAANAFITPMTLQALSGHRVYQSLLDAENEAAMSHISLARWADLILIAPASAHVIAKLANGFADDLLTTLCLATTAEIAIAPAMNVKMWSNAATQSNVNQLQTRQIKIIGPDVGIQACGETGEGRMVEPENILQEVISFFQKNNTLQNKKVVITAGPTQEAIDPVRYLSNHSSGKMGYAIAQAAKKLGAEVTLISGPTTLTISETIQKINVVSAQEMFDTVMQHIVDADIFISTAAVSDYRVANINPQKIKKSNDTLQLELIRNPDILSAVSQRSSRPFVVGFAAETENLIENAKTKLQKKELDLIVGNQVGNGLGFGSDFNELIVMTQENQTPYVLSFAPKQILATRLMEIICEAFLTTSTLLA